MLNWIGGLLDRIVAVISAVIFAQAPLFMQQYTQQLMGRVSELQMQVNAMRHAAGLSGKTLEQMANKFIENPDIDVVRQGEFMLGTLERWQHLSNGLTVMQESSIWSRPFSFLYNLNGDTFSSTLQQFKIGLPLSAEGGVYALIGVAVGYGVFAFIRGLGRKIYRAGASVLKNPSTKLPQN